jgi:hypothetical protein
MKMFIVSSSVFNGWSYRKDNYKYYSEVCNNSDLRSIVASICYNYLCMRIYDFGRVYYKWGVDGDWFIVLEDYKLPEKSGYFWLDYVKREL